MICRRAILLAYSSTREGSSGRSCSNAYQARTTFHTPCPPSARICTKYKPSATPDRSTLNCFCPRLSCCNTSRPIPSRLRMRALPGQPSMAAPVSKESPAHITIETRGREGIIARYLQFPVPKHQKLIDNGAGGAGREHFRGRPVIQRKPELMASSFRSCKAYVRLTS